MKILVTGGCGFIGSFLVDELIRQGHLVTILDNLEPQVHPNGQKPDYLNPRAKFIYGDVTRVSDIKKALKDNEIVFHLAAMVGVGQSQYQIKKYVDVNIGGTANLLDVLVNTKNRVKKLIVAGSMSSYGEGLYRCPKCGIVKGEMRPEENLRKKIWECICKCGKKLTPVPTPEETKQQCYSVYALTKKVQEEISLIIGKTYSLPTAVLRFFNVYGPRQSLSNPYTGVAAIFMSRIKNNNQPVIFEDGLQTRDFIYVTDVVAALILAMNKKEADYQVFNVGSGKPLTIREIATTIAKLYGKEIKPRITEKYRKGDIRHCYADITRIKKLLGFWPQVSFEDGMRMLIDWAKKVPAKDDYEKAHAELKKYGLA